MTRETKAQKALNSEFNTQARAFIRGLRSVDTTASYDGAPTRLDLETRLGILHISLYGTWVACRFEDVDRACAELNPGKLGQHHSHLNPHSGKWNIHFDHHWPVETRLQAFQQHVSRVIGVGGFSSWPHGVDTMRPGNAVELANATETVKPGLT